MSSIAGTSSMSFDKGMFSDPNMRPYLKEYYEASYAPMRERIAAMKEAEANGEAPKTVQMADGTVAHELSAAQYESAIPSFDKWLEMSQKFSAFDMERTSEDSLEHTRKMLDRVERDLGPDQPSGVRTVFSDGDRILGYITQDGGLVTHSGGSALSDVAAEADRLNLTGEAKIAYITEHGEEALNARHGNVTVQTYDSTTMPSRREFAATWYPGHNADAAYMSTIAELKETLAQQEAWHDQQMENLNKMRAFLLQAMEEGQAA